MKSINISKEGLVEFYGNRAGYIKDNTAVMDEMFRRDEIEQHLKNENIMNVIWKNGVYDKLIQGETEDLFMLKNCRIHQLKPDVDMRMKFISYAELQKRGFGNPDMSNYKIVFDGSLGTNDLEKIYELLNREERPETYAGYPLSQSDVIELYDGDGSEFYYVDSYGFVKLDETGPEQTEEIEQAEMMREQVEEQHVRTPETQTEIVPEKIQSPAEPDDEFQVETFRISM